MKYKILFISLIIILLTCSCKNDTLENIVVKETGQASMKEETNAIPKEEPIMTPSSKENMPKVKPKASSQVKETSKTEVTIDETKPKVDNSVDEASLDYPIHKGRIDCKDESSCQDISLPLQFKYKDLISNAIYIEVLSKNSQVLGYFIEYIFTEYQYESDDECKIAGESIKSDLKDKITSYECTDDNTLKLVTSY